MIRSLLNELVGSSGQSRCRGVVYALLQQVEAVNGLVTNPGLRDISTHVFVCQIVELGHRIFGALLRRLSWKLQSPPQRCGGCGSLLRLPVLPLSVRLNEHVLMFPNTVWWLKLNAEFVFTPVLK